MESWKYNAIGLGALLVALAGQVASAQDALGSGRVLDSNQQFGSGGVNTKVSDFYADLALRNAIITGNSPGGSHFRAEVGYRAAGDFLGSTGSDLLYNFDRDSYFSGLAAREVRGINALQLQMNVSVTGQSNAQGLIITRPGGGESASMLDPNVAVRRVDPFAALQGSLRSTSAYMIRQADRPAIVGQRDMGNGVVVPLAASPLVGVRPFSFENVAISGPMDASAARRNNAEPGDALNPAEQLRGPQDPALEQARLVGGAQADARSSDKDALDRPLVDPSMRPVSQHEQLLDTLRRSTDQIDLRIAPTSATPSLETIDPSVAPDAAEQSPPDAIDEPDTSMPDLDVDAPEESHDAANPLDELDAALRRLSTALGPNQRSEPRPGQSSSTTETQGDEPAAFDPLDPQGRRPSPTDEPEDSEAKFDPALQLLIDAMAQEDFTLRRIAPENDAPGDLFTTHMRAGETALRDGRWMDAEERFAVALTLRPGDAMAALGRVQAQIGAGLLRSAASNLRDLMRAYPELASARLDPGLMPPGQRLERIAEQLQHQRNRRSAGWVDAAFLSAYLARLLNDRITLLQAFDDLERAHKAAEITPDPVYAFLERVWLAETYNVNNPNNNAPSEQPSGKNDSPTR